MAKQKQMKNLHGHEVDLKLPGTKAKGRGLLVER